jgi:hypothetical protein
LILPARTISRTAHAGRGVLPAFAGVNLALRSPASSGSVSPENGSSSGTAPGHLPSVFT